MFIVDLVSTLPIAEITDAIAAGNDSDASYVQWFK